MRQTWQVPSSNGRSKVDAVPIFDTHVSSICLHTEAASSFFYFIRSSELHVPQRLQSIKKNKLTLCLPIFFLNDLAFS